MTQYASQTTVSTAKSKAEIERILERYDADQFMYGWDNDRAVVQFRMAGRLIRFLMKMPDRNEFVLTPTGRTRALSKVDEVWEQSKRQRWRGLKLIVQAKLEAVESGITTFEEEFLAHIVLPDGNTVGGWVLPQVAAAYEIGKMPDMLALGDGT